MTREEIEKISVAEPYFFDTNIEDWYKIRCTDGLETVKPNTESLWHDVNEKPKRKQWLLVQIGNDYFDTFVIDIDNNEDWRNWCNKHNIMQWTYIDDILPKGQLS